jgi:hypothetical protein
MGAAIDGGPKQFTERRTAGFGGQRKHDAQYGSTGPPLPAGIERSRRAAEIPDWRSKYKAADWPA